MTRFLVKFYNHLTKKKGESYTVNYGIIEAIESVRREHNYQISVLATEMVNPDDFIETL